MKSESLRLPEIKFAHNYSKLWGQTYAVLIGVYDMVIPRDMNPDLIEYDTKIRDGEYYELKPGKYVQLVFIGNKNIPFCTLRSAYHKRKNKYYKGLIGDVFNIVVVGKDKKRLPLAERSCKSCHFYNPDFESYFCGNSKKNEKTKECWQARIKNYD